MTSQWPEQSAKEALEPIAIVGVGCRLPGRISTAQQLLEALRDGRDCITEVPADRWSLDAFYDPDPVTPGKTYVRYGGFLEDIDRFDAGFFGISDAEASRMDPQQRLVLETVWHALEDAGQAASELEHSNTGVFLAMMNTNGYAQLKGLYEGLPGVTAYDAMGDAMSITAGRISHFLGLEGPCLSLDTACSSSLVALHLARQSILSGDCDTAIVVGVNAILHPGIHIAFSKVGLMSRAGRCAAFDASADGYIRGEGCVAIIIRRQSQAMARGDRILASIVGTAVNQDGRTPALTAPNGRSQEKVIRTALARVGHNPNEIGYVEAHGTGTPVGDPIEMSAIVNVYGPGRTENEPLYVGSVKSNFGHIEAGAGLLGLVKAALSLDQELILPSVHFKQLNPSIDLGQAPVKVPTRTVPWPRGKQRRMAGINSFGYSGTNAHAILQEAPLVSNGTFLDGEADSQLTRPSELVTLSAKSAESLQELVDLWIDFLEQYDDTPLRDIAFTANTGRSPMSHRLAIVGRTREEIGDKLRSWRNGRMSKGLLTGQTKFRRTPKIAFMFTGQGSQYPDMGKQLYETEPQFAAAIDRVASFMDPEMGTPLKDILFGPESATYLDNTRYVQPALFAVEYALAEMLFHWGVEPDYVIGHSVGEITAACVAGVLDLRDAVRFVVARGRLMGGLPRGGKMVAISATLAEVQEWVQGREDRVSIATVNSPQAVVVSGTAEGVDAVAELARAAGRRTKELEVSHAFHSPLMDPILDELAEIADTLRISRARIPVVSNVTGELLPEDITGQYWSSHVRQAVLFHRGMETLIEAGCSLLIEVGPHPALTPAVATAFDTSKIKTVPMLARDRQDTANVLEALAALFVNGVSVNLERLFWSPAYRRVSLPLYPFRRDRHWLSEDGTLDGLAEPRQALAFEPHPILGKAVTVGPRRAIFETNLAAKPPWTDHRVLGSTMFPGTAYLEMAARGFAAATGHEWRSLKLMDVVFERPLVLTYRKPKKVTLTLDMMSNGKHAGTFVISSGDGNGEVHCRGRITIADEQIERVSLPDELSRRRQPLEVAPFYGQLREGGLEYGAKFATVRELWAGEPGSGEAIGRIKALLAEDGSPADPYANAVLLDGCLHVFGAALGSLDAPTPQGTFVPATIQSVTLQRELPDEVWSLITLQSNGDGRAAVANLRVLNQEGEVLVAIDGLELRQKASLASPGLTAASNGSQPSGAGSQSRDELVDRLVKLTRQERVRTLSRWLASEIKDVMGQAAEGLDFEDIDPSIAFVEIGLDSLLVTELQRRIQEKLEFRFQPMQGLDYQSIESLAEFVHDQVLAGDVEAKDKGLAAAKVAGD